MRFLVFFLLCSHNMSSSQYFVLIKHWIKIWRIIYSKLRYFKVLLCYFPIVLLAYFPSLSNLLLSWWVEKWFPWNLCQIKNAHLCFCLFKLFNFHLCQFLCKSDLRIYCLWETIEKFTKIITFALSTHKFVYWMFWFLS